MHHAVADSPGEDQLTPEQAQGQIEILLREYDSLRSEAVQTSAVVPVTSGWLALLLAIGAFSVSLTDLSLPWLWIAGLVVIFLAAFLFRMRRVRRALTRINVHLAQIEDRINNLSVTAWDCVDPLLTWETSMYVYRQRNPPWVSTQLRRYFH